MLVTKLVTHDLAECADNSPTVIDFKRDLRAALDDHFALRKADTTSHPFVTATILHPATKGCELVPEWLRNTAYDHALTSQAAASLPAKTDDGDADESGSPPAKHAKTVSIKVPGNRCCYPGSGC